MCVHVTFRRRFKRELKRNLDKRYAHRADGAPRSAKRCLRRSEMKCGQGQGRTADRPLRLLWDRIAGVSVVLFTILVEKIRCSLLQSSKQDIHDVKVTVSV